MTNRVGMTSDLIIINCTDHAEDDKKTMMRIWKPLRAHALPLPEYVWLTSFWADGEAFAKMSLCSSHGSSLLSRCLALNFCKIHEN